MYLFAGIGNIGKKYSYTRHNIGFLIIDRIIKQYEFKEDKQAFDNHIYRGIITKKKVMLIKPMTFVNNSGEAISKLVSFYKIPLEKIFVFHDDMDLSLSRIKIKLGGSAAGHNGIKSIDTYIGKNYNRVRIGIGNPTGYLAAKDYVLENFSKNEYNKIVKKLDILAENIHYLINYESNNLLNILSNA